MTVLSLFDGISCGQVAITQLIEERRGEERRGEESVLTYYASEIKDYAIQVTQKNFPNTIQLGDVKKIDFTQFSGKIDLLIGGSPCQDHSTANKKRTGLQGEKSSLFWEFVRALRETKAKYFFLENVSMKNEDYEIISRELGTYPIKINSKLVSAQLRNRLYWFNWGEKTYDMFGFPTCNIPQPEDRKITLQSILESGYTDREKQLAFLKRSYDCLPRDFEKCDRYLKKRHPKFPMPIVFKEKNCNIDSWRLHTQSELEKLQTLPIGYTSCLPFLKASDCIGDGWTIEVIKHIFRFLFQENSDLL